MEGSPALCASAFSSASRPLRLSKADIESWQLERSERPERSSSFSPRGGGHRIVGRPPWHGAAEASWNGEMRVLRRQQAMAAVRLGFGAAGVTALVLLIRSVGPEALWAALRPAVRWLPLLLALEAARIGVEALGTLVLYGRRASLIPGGHLVRTHLIGYAVNAIAPAGRTAAEATKAALLARWVGGAQATAVAATNQALTLLASGLVSIPCAYAAWRITGRSAFTGLLVAHAIGLTAVGVAMRHEMRGRRVTGWLGGRFRAVERHAEAFRSAAAETALVPRSPLAAMMLGRVLQIVQYAVVAHAAGVDVSALRALFAQGVSFISMALGVLVPGQIGAAEGAFALSAEALGTTVASATVIALLVHCVQAVWILVGTLTPLVWPAAARAEKQEAAGAEP